MSEQGAVVRPHILSLHPTMQCDYGCNNCYLKKDIDSNTQEKPPTFFMELLNQAKLAGIQEIALPINYVNYKKRNTSVQLDSFNEHDWANCDKNLHYFKWVANFCLKESIRLTATCNYDFFEHYSQLELKPLELVSISINDFVTPTDEKISKALNIMSDLKSSVQTVNCNILLSDRMVRLLKNGLSEKILSVADSMYLLASKPLQVSSRVYYGWYTELNDAGILVDSEKIIVDSCMRYSLGLTGTMCDRHKMVYVNPYGEIKMCSFDSRNLAIIDKPQDFKNIFERYFPMQRQKTCNLVNVE